MSRQIKHIEKRRVYTGAITSRSSSTNFFFLLLESVPTLLFYSCGFVSFRYKLLKLFYFCYSFWAGGSSLLQPYRSIRSGFNCFRSGFNCFRSGFNCFRFGDRCPNNWSNRRSYYGGRFDSLRYGRCLYTGGLIRFNGCLFTGYKWGHLFPFLYVGFINVANW